jgi:hypothetical protein
MDKMSHKVLQWDNISHTVMNIKKLGKMSQRDKISKYGKGVAKTGRKYVRWTKYHKAGKRGWT